AWWCAASGAGGMAGPRPACVFDEQAESRPDGSGVPSVVGPASGRGTRHAAGSPAANPLPYDTKARGREPRPAVTPSTRKKRSDAANIRLEFAEEGRRIAS